MIGKKMGRAAIYPCLHPRPTEGGFGPVNTGAAMFLKLFTHIPDDCLKPEGFFGERMIRIRFDALPVGGYTAKRRYIIGVYTRYILENSQGIKSTESWLNRIRMRRNRCNLPLLDLVDIAIISGRHPGAGFDIQHYLIANLQRRRGNHSTASLALAFAFF